MIFEEEGRLANLPQCKQVGAETESVLYRSIKRILDLMGAIFGLLVFGVLMLAIIFLIRITMGAPVFFLQLRLGLHGKLFTIYKFRTMTPSEGNRADLKHDAERLTRLGRFLRKTSLDELPELVNVLKGDMSLVGPRPLIPQYLERYSAEQGRRHEVVPGVTGWAQINGRNNISWEEKFQLDVWYVDNRSFLLDLKILATTAWKVLRGEGISAPGEVTMPEFMGTDKRISRK